MLAIGLTTDPLLAFALVAVVFGWLWLIPAAVAAVSGAVGAANAAKKKKDEEKKQKEANAKTWQGVKEEYKLNNPNTSGRKQKWADWGAAQAQGVRGLGIDRTNSTAARGVAKDRVDQQNLALDMLQRRAQGQDSVVRYQAAQQKDQLRRDIASQLASGRRRSAGGVRAAMQAQSRLGTDMASATAAGMAQERLAAQQQYAQALQGARGADLQQLQMEMANEIQTGQYGLAREKLAALYQQMGLSQANADNAAALAWEQLKAKIMAAEKGQQFAADQASKQSDRDLGLGIAKMGVDTIAAILKAK